MCGRWAMTSSTLTGAGMFATPSSAAEAAATPSSSVSPEPMNCAVKVRMLGLTSRARATSAVESMPLDSSAPTGTSERMWSRTDSRRASAISL